MADHHKFHAFIGGAILYAARPRSPENDWLYMANFHAAERRADRAGVSAAIGAALNDIQHASTRGDGLEIAPMIATGYGLERGVE